MATQVNHNLHDKPLHDNKPLHDPTTLTSSEKDQQSHREDLALERIGSAQREDEAIALGWRTWLAVAALFVLNFVQVVALTGPPAILTYIGEDLDGATYQNWIPNVLSLVQAVLGPSIAFASDTFQARKEFLVLPTAVSFIGCAIAPGSSTIFRVIGAQVLIGIGFAIVPLSYCIPSEILPRRWRPITQAIVCNVSAGLAAVSSPLIAGKLTKNNPHTGWRNFYWYQMGLWGMCSICLYFGYRPPPRHSRLDHLTFFQKLKRCDIPGMILITASGTLILTGLSLGDNPWPWANARCIGTIVSGAVLFLFFGFYEWRINKEGIIHHALFIQGRTFGVLIALMFIEGCLIFSFIVFFPALTVALYETDPVLTSLRTTALWFGAITGTIFWGSMSTYFKSIRPFLSMAFAVFTAGIIIMTQITPSSSGLSIAGDTLAGFGFGGPLCLIISACQLCTPPDLIATATAVITSARALAASMATAWYAAALTTQIGKKLPNYVADAALAAGLPPSSLPDYLGAFLGKLPSVTSIAGVTPAILGASAAAASQALADSFRIIYIVAAPFGGVAIVLVWAMKSLRREMHYVVDHPMELELHHKQHLNQTINPNNDSEKGANDHHVAAPVTTTA